MWNIDLYDLGILGFLGFLVFMVGREFFKKEEKTILPDLPSMQQGKEHDNRDVIDMFGMSFEEYYNIFLKD